MLLRFMMIRMRRGGHNTDRERERERDRERKRERRKEQIGKRKKILEMKRLTVDRRRGVHNNSVTVQIGSPPRTVCRLCVVMMCMS